MTAPSMTKPSMTAPLLTTSRQIPRNALIWLIVSMFSLLIPHLPRVPLWLVLVTVGCAVWRLMVHSGRWSFPPRSIKVGLMLSAFAGILLSYRTVLGLEPMVALLLAAYALKLLELTRRQDAYVLLFLSYFVCVTEFLFTQDLLVVLYSALNVLLVTTALVALHEGVRDRFHWGSLRRAGLMLAQAFPLMLVLFFLFPRFGPLWAMPLKSNAAKTGVSDTMRPGDISRLGQSDEVAFRAQFEGDIPPRSELYWRGLVFNRLSEGTWSGLKYFEVPATERRPKPVDRRGESLRYSIIMMPTQQHWLYSLRYAEPRTTGVMAAGDYRLFSPVEIEDQYRYRVESWPEAALETELSPWRRKLELDLPPLGDPQTRELARQMRQQSDSDADFITSVLRYFREQPFVYTLQPPLLGDNPMDDFLFSTRRGFCEHYAYAFVVMMRAAGVPARVVAGYQGGEINPVNGTVIVHQFDAHAWAEVWLPGEGWRRVDPTAAVSPDRIEGGLEQAMALEGSFLEASPLSPLRYRNVDWVNWVRLRYDALTYRWQSWVVGFDGEQQLEVLQRWLGNLDVSKFLYILFGSFSLVLIPVAVSLLRRPAGHQRTPLEQLYLLSCKRFAALGVARQTGEGASSYASRIALELPAAAGPAARIARAYTETVYQPAMATGQHNQQQAMTEIRSALAELKRIKPAARRPVQ